jgi:hypothetical protein
MAMSSSLMRCPILPSLLPPDRIQSRDQFSARLAVKQSRDREAISPLKGSQRRLGLGRKEAVDRAWVIPKRLYMRFRDVDIASREEPIGSGPAGAGGGCLCLRGDARGEQHPGEP